MEIIAIAIVVIGIIALVMWLLVTRGLQLKQLLEDGVDIDGVVVRQFKHNPKGPQSTDYFLRYRYRDSQGGEHEYKSNVNYDYWTAHPEGSAIAITYSVSRPHISAPHYLVEQARTAMSKKKADARLSLDRGAVAGRYTLCRRARFFPAGQLNDVRTHNRRNQPGETRFDFLAA
jgi:hypothetical protein